MVIQVDQRMIWKYFLLFQLPFNINRFKKKKSFLCGKKMPILLSVCALGFFSSTFCFHFHILSSDEMKKKLEETNALLAAEFDSERSHHQRLVKEHARLQQRLENLQSEMAVMNSPGGHKRTPSDISAISLESYTSSVSPDEVKYDDEGPEEKVGTYIL